MIDGDQLIQRKCVELVELVRAVCPRPEGLTHILVRPEDGVLIICSLDPVFTAMLEIGVARSMETYVEVSGEPLGPPGGLPN